MPYIDRNRRTRFDSNIANLIKRLKDTDIASAGDLNYVFSEILVGSLGIDDNPKYDKINTAVGVLECVKLELYRRVAAPYEDYKVTQSGDISCYSRFVGWLRALLGKK